MHFDRLRPRALALAFAWLATPGCGAGGSDPTAASSESDGGPTTSSTSSESSSPTTSSTSSESSSSTSSSTGDDGPTTSSSTGDDGPVIYRHGDMVTIEGDFGSNDVIKTFLGGADGKIESLSPGQSMESGDGWSFNDLGGPTSVEIDAERGKVLFTPEDSDHYNATRRFDPGFAIEEQRYFYKAHWVRNVMLLDGMPYAKSYQWKHERVNWENSVVDGDCEIKVHNWFAGGGGVLTFVNRSADDQSVYYGGQAADSNGGWALLEILVFTGTEGLEDGKLITRVHKDGKTVISQNRQAERIYADPSLRLRHFVEQNYFGNFGQVEDGVDNPLPKPEVRELWSDDSRVLVGNTAETGWRRVELRDSVDLAGAALREVQDWVSWDGSITLRLNAGGLPAGEHDLFLVVIGGVDADGWDVVTHSVPIRVGVD
ncbi:hypothetical protein [Nannocystis pusilla]|uniref:Uncharacterized protein n=1 Tax=Nannocystis pusilla TaxID=889268 RepID=A0ABS7TNT5_9BACT|nr:hypothetical protein [Nannocystis pusilla]MBZ5709741.1 hypothetical protein [Nannocystis pusilla]